MELDKYINNTTFPIRKKSETSLFNEYELDKWKSFEKFISEKFGNLSLCNYLTAVEEWVLESYPYNHQQPVCINGNVELINKQELISRNYEIIIEALGLVKKRYDFQSIIELGSGLGNNLAIVHECYPDILLQSKEYSETARRLQKRYLLSHIKSFNIEKFNLYSENNNLELKNSVCFTSYVFSLLKFFPVKILDNLINSGAKYVINIEPLYELQNINNNLDAKIKEYIIANEYNQDYYSKLLEYESLGKIKIIVCQKNIYGINAFFPASLLIWEICDGS